MSPSLNKPVVAAVVKENAKKRDQFKSLSKKNQNSRMMKLTLEHKNQTQSRVKNIGLRKRWNQFRTNLQSQKTSYL